MSLSGLYPLQDVDTDNHSWANYFMCAYKVGRHRKAAAVTLRKATPSQLVALLH